MVFHFNNAQQREGYNIVFTVIHIIQLLTKKVNSLQINTVFALRKGYTKPITTARRVGMGKEVSYQNRDQFIQLGIAIATLRRIRGMSQEKLAEKAGISRSLLSNIEAPNLAYSFSLDVLFNVARALDVPPEKLLVASVLPDEILNKNTRTDETRR